MNKFKSKISIIIPCYNVEKYIKKCLDSLIFQMADYDYEIILINDCSTDNTDIEINNYLSENNYNIKYLANDKNMGAGYSRNRAISISKGEYISFIDADDYVDENYFECMLSLIEKDKLDVVVCDINIVYDDGTPSVLSNGCEGTFNRENIINTGMAASPCNKIMKRELLLKFPFAEGIMNEDVASIIPILSECNKIGYTACTKYNYVQHTSSVQNSRFSKKRFDIFEAVDICLNRLGDNYYKYIDIIVFQQLYLFYIYVLSREKNYFKRFIYLRKFYKNSKKYNFNNNKYILEHISRNGKNAVFYYTLLLKLTVHGLCFTINNIMFLFNIYHSIKYSKFVSKNFSVVKKKITLKDLIKMAKKQSKMKSVNNTVSVIIPNYNYDIYLYQRLYSILYQDYKIDEIIILDDCSKDNSRKTIDLFVDSLKKYVNIRKIYNSKNSGTPFKQWEKGFINAKCKYVWIAEADDYCKKNMLSNLMKSTIDDKVVISYCDTAFIDKDGVIRLKTIKPEIDIQKSSHWESDFVNDGIKEIKDYSYLNCTIANVSSCIFKNQDYSNFFKMSSDYKQAGDWLFYVNVMSTGKISFINKPLNYYRVHGNNVTSITKKELHVNEIKKIHLYLKEKYNLDIKHGKNMQKRIEFLYKVWDLR